GDPRRAQRRARLDRAERHPGLARPGGRSGLATDRSEEIGEVLRSPPPKGMAPAEPRRIDAVAALDRVQQLLDDRRGREPLARQRLSRHVREVQAIAGAEQELEEAVLVALARGDVALAASRPAEVERIFRLGRRELALAQSAREDNAKRHGPQRRQRGDDDALAGGAPREPLDATTRELARDPEADAQVAARPAEVDLAERVDASQAPRELLFFRGIRGRHVRLDEAAQKGGPLAHREPR